MLFDWYDYDRNVSSFDNFRRQFDRLLSEQGARGPAASTSVPAANIFESPEELTVQLAIPGVPRESLELELTDNVLTITGERKIEVPEGFVARRRERAPTQFRRTFALPHPVNPDRTQAALRDGILTVRIARAEPPKPRQIDVTEG
jgi:HSP20 family protein